MGVARSRPALAHPEPLAVVLVGHGDQAAQGAQQRVAARVHRDLVLGGHADGGEHQEAAEHVDHPVEVLQQRLAPGDEGAAQDQRPEHSEEEDPVLVGRRDGEVAEHQGEHEDVLHRQRLLDEVAGEVLLAGAGAAPHPDHHSEGDPEGDPGRGWPRPPRASDTSWASRWKTKRSRARARRMTPSVAPHAHSGVSTSVASVRGSGRGGRLPARRAAGAPAPGSEGQAERFAEEAHERDAGPHRRQVGVQEARGGHLGLAQPHPGAEVDAPAGPR